VLSSVTDRTQLVFVERSYPLEWYRHAKSLTQEYMLNRLEKAVMVCCPSDKEEQQLGQIRQFYCEVGSEEEKLQGLFDLIEYGTSLLVYVNTNAKAMVLKRELEDHGINLMCLLQGVLQTDNDENPVGAFKLSGPSITIAVGSQQIDIGQMPSVVNYELPLHFGDYLLRLGGRRCEYTGRAVMSHKSPQTAVSYVTANEERLLKAIRDYYRAPITEMPMDVGYFL
jgi:superfamily II DNA/RNA helicase